MTKEIRCIGESHGDNYAIYHGDCADVLRQLPDRSVGFSVFSPPFLDLFTYSDSECDMGNNANYADESEQQSAAPGMETQTEHERCSLSRRREELSRTGHFD